MQRNYWFDSSLCLILMLAVGCKADMSADTHSSPALPQFSESIDNVQPPLPSQPTEQDKTSDAGAMPLPVVVPDSVELLLSNGRSASGDLGAFDANKVTLSANGHNKAFLVKDVKKASFRGDIWTTSLDGNRRRGQIRGIEIAISDVPLPALTVNPITNTGVLQLAGVLDEGEYEKLRGDETGTHTIKSILFRASAEKMIVEIAPIRKE